MNKLISVIIPVYQAEKYIERCLNSIINQTYQNIEIIIVNDGSTDNSEDICLLYRNKDNRCKYYRQDNSGVSAARNKGMQVAQGEWICFVDPDDYIETNMIENLFNALTENCDIVACCCNAEVNGKSVLNTFFNEDIEFLENKYDLFMQLLDNNYQAKSYRYTAIGVPWGKLYRKLFLDKNQISFDIELKRMQDNVFNFKAFQYARKINYINQPYYHYVVEHVEKYVKFYEPNAFRYLAKVIVSQEKVLTELELLNDKKIFSAIVNEAFSIYILSIQKSFYYCPNEKYWEKCKYAKWLINQEPYVDLFSKSKQTKKIMLLRWMVKFNLIGILINLKEYLKRAKRIRV